MAADQSPSSPMRECYVKLAFAAGVAALALEVIYLLSSPLPYDMVGYLVGRDFVNVWMGAQLALTGDPTPWFDTNTYNDALAQMFGAGYPRHWWSYPPHHLLFAWPFGLMPYVPAYLLWCVLGFAAYLFVCADGERRPERLLLLAVAPAVIVNVAFGQNGFVSAVLLIGGLINLDRRPILAGVLFAFLTFKPQLGILLPVMLLLTGRWRVIAAAAVTVALLFLATVLTFGWHVWTDYFAVAVPAQTAFWMKATGFFMPMMPTVFMNLRLAGYPIDVAYAVQAVVSAAVIAAVIWTFMRRRDPVLANAVLVTATVAVLPFAFNYDFVMFGWVLAKLVDRADNDAWDYGLMFAIWTLPVTTAFLGFAGLPISSLVPFAFGARLVWKLYRTGQVEHSSPRPSPAAGLATPVFPRRLTDSPPSQFRDQDACVPKCPSYMSH
jgi:hypothetical protein